jgi:hypothetical protein
MMPRPWWEADTARPNRQFDTRTPHGTVRVKGEDTIEIRINYDNPRDPLGFFLAQFPSGVAVRYILAMALDIKYVSRAVVSRPVLFVRVPTLFQKKDRFGSKTKIYKSVQSLFKRSVLYDPMKFEIVPSSVRDEDFEEVISALEKLREEAVDDIDDRSSVQRQTPNQSSRGS